MQWASERAAAELLGHAQAAESALAAAAQDAQQQEHVHAERLAQAEAGADAAAAALAAARRDAAAERHAAENALQVLGIAFLNWCTTGNVSWAAMCKCLDLDCSDLFACSRGACTYKTLCECPWATLLRAAPGSGGARERGRSGARPPAGGAGGLPAKRAP